MVGICMLTLVPGCIGGSETYARALTSALARVGQLEYEVFLPSIARDAGDGLPSRVVDSYPASMGMTGRAAAMARAAALPRALRREIDPGRLDAVHFPLTVTLPRIPNRPTVVTLLDLQHLLFPGLFSRAERAYRRVAYEAWVRRATLVIAISEHVKETIVELLRIPPERVRVARLGVDHGRFRPSDAGREPFVLYPANAWPHKNHRKLLAAFAAVRRARPELRLVLTGSWLERLPRSAGVEVRGRVSSADVVDLYRRASAVVFPSLYEGFGLPVLEAMASGCPVAASSVGALPEVCADAARIFDPRSETAIEEAILDVLDHPEPWRERGLTRAAEFTWERTAAAHEAAYRDAAAIGA